MKYMKVFLMVTCLLGFFVAAWVALYWALHEVVFDNELRSVIAGILSVMATFMVLANMPSTDRY
jgi:uncharacterized membrane protein HdeD (DUF308 family)